MKLFFIHTHIYCSTLTCNVWPVLCRNSKLYRLNIHWGICLIFKRKGKKNKNKMIINQIMQASREICTVKGILFREYLKFIWWWKIFFIFSLLIIFNQKSWFSFDICRFSHATLFCFLFHGLLSRARYSWILDFSYEFRFQRVLIKSNLLCTWAHFNFSNLYHHFSIISSSFFFFFYTSSGFGSVNWCQ